MNDTRQKIVESKLGKSSLKFYIAQLALHYYILGNLVEAKKWRQKSIELVKIQNRQIDPVDLHNISLIEMSMGDIKKARETVSQALTLSHETRDLDDLIAEFAYKAYSEFLLGNSMQACKDFEIAIYYEQKRVAEEQQLYAIYGNYQAEFFVRIQSYKKFEDENTWNIQASEKYNKNQTLAYCQLLQGWYEICRRQLTKAEEALVKAEHILRPSGMLQEICQLDRIWALLAEAKEDYQKGLQHVNDALLTCADKGFRLWQADHFVLRGRLYLLQFQKEDKKDLDLVEKAGDDGCEALKIAENTGYIWAKVDALELLCSYHQTRAKLSKFNTEDEKESARRYEKEAKAIQKGLFLTEKQMEQAKAKAKKIFEKQTAGWDEEV